MPKSRRTYKLYAAYIEAIHDEGISFTWPGIEPVSPLSCKDLNLLYSAAESPYQEGYGAEFYPTIYSKAAYLFFHVVTSHIFQNGNKRTGVLCLDQFLLANSMYLTLDNDQLQQLAISTAEYKVRERKFTEVISELEELVASNCVSLGKLKKPFPMMYDHLAKYRRSIRRTLLNQEGTVRQEQRFGRR